MGSAQHVVCEMSAFRIETPEGFVIVDSGVNMRPGDEVAFQYDGYPMVGKLFASELITQDGETIDGDGLEGIIVLGKVTATIVDDNDEFRPTI